MTLSSTFKHFLSMAELHISQILQFLLCIYFLQSKLQCPQVVVADLPKFMALFLILEFAVAQRKPLMKMEIHSYTNQMQYRQQHRLPQTSKLVIIPLLCRDCSVSGRWTHSLLMHFPSLHNVTFHLFRNFTELCTMGEIFIPKTLNL